MKIAIIQPGCFGDNVNSTLMFKPIKDKYPTSEIDIFTAERYHQPFLLNPYINNIIKLPSKNKNDALNLIYTIAPSNYDLIIKSHPLINKTWSSHKHPELGENLILSWVNWLERHDINYDYPLKTDLILSEEEEKTAKEFLDKHIHPQDKKGIILIEAEGESGQSFWDWRWTEKVTNTLHQMGYVVLINNVKEASVAQQLQLNHKNRTTWVGNLSLRTVTSIYDHCDCFISVSSGLSNACNTQQRSTKPKWIEVVNSLACSSNVVGSKEKLFWLENNLEKFINKIKETL